MEAVGGIDFMTANRIRLPTTATCSANYQNLMLTKDRVIWPAVMKNKNRSAKSSTERELTQHPLQWQTVTPTVHYQ